MQPLDYFAFFKYSPTFYEYWQFYPKIIGQKKLKQILKTKNIQIIKNRVVSKKNKSFLSSTLERALISQRKIAKYEKLIEFLGKLPWIKFIGFSGTVSMLNAKDKDDIDLFIITKANQMWTARFWLIFLTTILGVRRKPKMKKYENKLCLNLFFSEADLKVPKHKQTNYIAHELIQLKPVVNKGQTYERLLYANSWVKNMFPNTGEKFQIPNYKLKPKKLNLLENSLENLLKVFQQRLIKRYKTKEYLTPTQLWFFPYDFETKITRYFRRLANS